MYAQGNVSYKIKARSSFIKNEKYVDIIEVKAKSFGAALESQF
jgi:hypothetical protein